MSLDPIIRGENAKRALEEFLSPAFDHVMDTYMKRLAEIAAAEPWATDKIAKLALAARIAKEVRSQVEALVHAGEVASRARSEAEKIERIPLAKRRLMGIPVPN